MGTLNNISLTKLTKFFKTFSFGLNNSISFKILLLFFAVNLILSCSSAPHKLDKQNKSQETSLIDTRKEYDDFWEYMENFDFNFTSSIKLSEEHQQFAEGLKLVEYSEFDSAEIIFRKLYETSHDIQTIKNSKKVLVDILFFKSKWFDILELDSTETAIDSPYNSLRLADAFSRAKAEKISFPDKTVSLPIYISPTGCPIIKVIINGEGRFFWLDTGANYSVLSSDIAQELSIFPISYEKTKALTGTTIRVDVYPTVIDTLDIAGVKIFNHPAIIVHDFDLKFKFFGVSNITKVDGILGWKAIQHLDAVMDYKKKILIVSKPQIDSSRQRNLFWLGCPVIRVKNLDGKPLLFGLDLGAERTTITANIFKKVSFAQIYSITKQIGSLGGWIYNNARMISSLTLDIGNEIMHFEDIGTGFQQKKLFVKLDGILGTDFMREGKIRINNTAGIFEFSIE